MHLSPSDYHRHLVATTKPSLQFKGGKVRSWQNKLRPVVQHLLGGIPKERPPLRVRRLWQREHRFGSIEKIVFTAEAYADVPAYVCLPTNEKPPYRFMICLQGHNTGMHNSIAVAQHDERKAMKPPGDRDFALGCMRRGIAALCIEQRSFGERGERKQKMRSDQSCTDAASQALMLGKTLLGERVFDVDRGIDYLAERGDVAMDSIGVMGNSGGGTVSMFSAALLPRIAFAMPSCYFCTFADSIMSIYHCLDNFVPGLLRYADMADIMGLFAPKPVVIVAGERDDLFPIAATRAEFADLKRIYRAAGAADRCHLVVGKGGHRFYEAAAWRVMSKEIERARRK